MAKNANFVSHKKSKQIVDGKPKLPLASDIVEGEIAINFGKDVETLSIKNESGDVVTFSSDNYYTEQKLGSAFTGSNSGITVTDVIVENEEIVSTALNDLNDRIDNLDLGNEVEVNSGDTPSGQTIELWIDESITPEEADVYTKNETSGATQISTALEGKAAQSDLTTLSGTVTGHTADTTIHLTPTEKGQLHTHSNKLALDSITGNVGSMAYENTSSYSSATEVNTALGNKANTSDLDNFFDDAKYEDSGTTKVINFYHGNTIKATIDASDFIVDGMVESVSAGTSGNTTVLDIKWNTAAGGQETIVDIGDIFEADNYYTKSETSGATEISNALEGKVNTSDIVSAITPSNSGSTAPIATKVVAENELTVSSALNDLNGTLSAHTADTNIHLTSTEKTNLHAHSNKSYLDGITGTVGTMAYQNASSYSSATEVSTALSGKSNTGHTHDDRYYTESEINALVGSGYTNTTITDVIENMDQAVAAAITDLNDKIGDIESILATI